MSRDLAQYRYHKQWKLDRERGQLRNVDSGPARGHIDALRVQGWTTRSIAAAAGLSPQAVQHLVDGQQVCRRTTSAKILAVTGHSIITRPDRDGFVCKDGATRRVQALLAIGWRHADINPVMHAIDPMVCTTSQLVLHQAGHLIARGTHDAVAAAYDQLSMRHGPSTVTVKRARRAGYLPPLAWDDETIDDPAGRPAPTGAPQRAVDPIAVERALGGDHHTLTLTRAEAQAVAAHLTARGVGADEIGQRLHVSGRTVQRWRAIA